MKTSLAPGLSPARDDLGAVVRQMADDGTAKVAYHTSVFPDERSLGTPCAPLASRPSAYELDCPGQYSTTRYANQPAKEGQGWTDAQPGAVR